MVNTGLDVSRKARVGGGVNYEPMPKGEYTFRVKEIEPWKECIKNINVIQRDEKGNALKDDKGKNITVMEPNCKFYNCNVKLEVVGGDYDGRLVYHNLTTHPNMDFSIDNFLYGVGISELPASQIQTTCVGRMCKANIDIDSYDKTVQNKETGIDEIVKREVNRIKSFKPLNNQNVSDNLTDVNLGI